MSLIRRRSYQDSTRNRVVSFEVGDRVFGYCEGPFGARAEYMTIPQDGSVATMPASSTFEEVAPATDSSHSALSFRRKTNLRKALTRADTDGHALRTRLAAEPRHVRVWAERS